MLIMLIYHLQIKRLIILHLVINLLSSGGFHRFCDFITLFPSPWHSRVITFFIVIFFFTSKSVSRVWPLLFFIFMFVSTRIWSNYKENALPCYCSRKDSRISKPPGITFAWSRLSKDYASQQTDWPLSHFIWLVYSK